MKKKIGVIIVIVLITLLGLLVTTIMVPKLSFIRAIDNIIHNLNIKSKDEISFEANITSTGELYNVLNNSIIKGNYSSSDGFILKFDFTSNYQETINMNLYSKDNTYYYDSFFYEKSIMFDKSMDLSINAFKSNIKRLLMFIKSNNGQLNKKIINNQNVISFKLYKDMFNDLELDYPYNNLFDSLLNYLDNSDVSIYTSFITGKLYRIEFKNDNYLEIVNGKNEYIIRFINKDNEVHKIVLSPNKIEYTDSKGSNVLSSITIDYKIDNYNKIDLFDIDNSINIKDIDSALIKKNINMSKTKKELINIYYELVDKTNIFDLYVTMNEYNVYYKLPDKYINKYTGKSLKKYSDIDKELVYEIKNYTYDQVIDYIDDIYNENISKNYYKRVVKSATEEIENNGIKYNYKTIIKGYYYNYADYDNTVSTLYVWNMLDDNNAFIIEYDFQGSEITEEEIIKLIDIEISK